MSSRLFAVALASCVGLVLLQSACGARDPDPVAAPITIGVEASGDVFTMTGHVTAIDNGCFADGECSVRVDGLKVITMRGWSRTAWGKREPDIAVGDLVDVRCRKANGGCTLEGDPGFFIKSSR